MNQNSPTPLTIVLPCYNPPNDWVTFVKDGMIAMSKAIGFTPELIIVNDGSTNDLKEDVISLKNTFNQLQFIHLSENQGKGAALRAGINSAKTTYTIYTDIDFPYQVESLVAIYRCLLEEKMDVAVGVKNKSYYSQSPAIRTFVSKTLRKGIGIFMSMPITDTQCGLKGFNALGKEVFLKTQISRYLFDLEFVKQSFRKGLKVKAVAIALRPGVVFRSMDFKVLSSEFYNFIKILISNR